MNRGQGTMVMTGSYRWTTGRRGCECSRGNWWPLQLRMAACLRLAAERDGLDMRPGCRLTSHCLAMLTRAAWDGENGAIKRPPGPLGRGGLDGVKANLSYRLVQRKSLIVEAQEYDHSGKPVGR